MRGRERRERERREDAERVREKESTAQDHVGDTLPWAEALRAQRSFGRWELRRDKNLTASCDSNAPAYRARIDTGRTLRVRV